MSDKRELWPEVPEVDLGTIIRPREAHRCEDRWICRACAAEYCGSLSETSFAEHVAHAVPYLNVGRRVIYRARTGNWPMGENSGRARRKRRSWDFCPLQPTRPFPSKGCTLPTYGSQP